ncbi:protein sisterless A [Drosophila rhopaloa]|uniref:Protein sisterless A n=1 Tax=Drosophila rhopaloa TaxID=1041015 RepID=A0A6P4F8Y9_DRORH|nr:protein sisterless A [Drosophila rhopaloa]
MERSHLYLPTLSYAAMGHVYAPYIGSTSPASTSSSSSKPEQIEELVSQQLHHLKMHYADEEQRYVDQMLLENPIVVERRAPPPLKSEIVVDQGSNSGSGSGSDVKEAKDAQRQRAESCRKSRYNNKIKKAKLRFRHKFVSGQLKKSAVMLDTMRDVIAQAERQLLDRGFPAAALERMRTTFGLEMEH